ncbi:MAG TPA: hypothetical protein ENF22_02835 [Chloroflexi bacterium]|nr:hypothetical protein [Chloroflexota bacterium]
MIYQGKYENLAKYLEGLDQERVNMTFEEIEDILGEPLPEAAKNRAWWANSASNNHALNGWLNVGWETSKVNMKEKMLFFTKVPIDKLEAPQLSMSPRLSSPRRRYPRSSIANAELDLIVQRAGGVDRIREYMVIIERYLFGEITEMELGQELRRLYHRR